MYYRNKSNVIVILNKIIMFRRLNTILLLLGKGQALIECDFFNLRLYLSFEF
jgi:hypothetical protein